MLQEILSQMYVDPELLEQLSEENKQILFTKMREEQVRHWKEREKKLDKKQQVKKTPKKISFNLGADGKPWVWVMGEHKNDLPYEELVRRREQEEIEKERQGDMEVRKEAEELAKKETTSIQSLVGVFRAAGKFKRSLRKTDSKGIDSPDGPSEIPQNPHTGVVRTESQNVMAGMASESPTTRRRAQEQEEEELQRTLTRKATIVGLTPEDQLKFEKHRTEELYTSLQRARSISKKRAADMAKNVETWWQESQKKANEFDKVRRSSFKKAVEIVKKCPDMPDKILESIPAEKKQEIYRRMTIERKPKRPVRQAPAPPATRHGRFRKQSSFVRPETVPKTMSHLISWFNRNEAPRGNGREKDGSISVWFHGKLAREAAIRLLEPKPVGSFLLRLSSKIWGYTVSVKTYTECKHFLIDASSGQYCFVGPKQQKFRSLQELIKFYRANPITWSGQEVLLIPVAQEEENHELYRGLFDDEGISEDILAELEAEYEGSTL